jgi:hypothetical protein
MHETEQAPGTALEPTAHNGCDAFPQRTLSIRFRSKLGNAMHRTDPDHHSDPSRRIVKPLSIIGR